MSPGASPFPSYKGTARLRIARYGVGTFICHLRHNQESDRLRREGGAEAAGRASRGWRCHGDCRSGIGGRAVALAFSATVKVTVLAAVQPVHELNVLLLDVAGAVNVTDVPALQVSVELVVSEVVLLLSARATPIATPLAGLVEFKISR